jgi:hypothetical protein
MPSARFGQRFGERKSEVQTERRLERSWNATTAAVPLTEAERDCVSRFTPRRTRVKPQRNVRWSRAIKPIALTPRNDLPKGMQTFV